MMLMLDKDPKIISKNIQNKHPGQGTYITVWWHHSSLSETNPSVAFVQHISSVFTYKNIKIKEGLSYIIVCVKNLSLSCKSWDLQQDNDPEHTEKEDYFFYPFNLPHGHLSYFCWTFMRRKSNLLNLRQLDKFAQKQWEKKTC